MKRPHLILTLLAAGLSAGLVRGSENPNDPLAGVFFPPEVVMLAREQIGLSKEKSDALRAQTEKVQVQSEEIRKRLERETAALSALAKPDRVNEAALLTQLDKVLETEREMKRLQIATLTAIKNQLTPEQQTKLRELTREGAGKFVEETRKRLTEKVAQVQVGIQRVVESQRDPSRLVRTMQEEFKPLIDAGKPVEAEAVLDRVLAELKAGSR